MLLFAEMVVVLEKEVLAEHALPWLFLRVVFVVVWGEGPGCGNYGTAPLVAASRFGGFATS